MKASPLLSVLFCTIIFISCNNRRLAPKVTPAQDTAAVIPQALEKDEKSSSFLKRSYSRENLVDKMYAEMVDEKADLQKLEKQIDLLDQNDSLEALHKYEDKMDHYYSSARMIAQNITDSSIRRKAHALIEASAEQYKHQITPLDSLDNTIQQNKKTISNLHEYLKIASTLPLLEKYQKNNVPSQKPMKEKIKSQNEVIGQLGIKN